MYKSFCDKCGNEIPFSGDKYNGNVCLPVDKKHAACLALCPNCYMDAIKHLEPFISELTYNGVDKERRGFDPYSDKEEASS